MQINSPGDVETLVAAAKMPRRDFDIERFADAVQHVAVPRRGFFGTDVPQTQIDVKIGAFDVRYLAEVENILQIALRGFAGEFSVSVRRKVDLANGGRG